MILWPREGYTMPVIPKCKFHIFENSLHYKHLFIVSFQTYSACVAVSKSPVFTCFVCYRLFVTGPVSHCFYQLMEALIPTTDPHCIIKRLLLDRLIFAPGFLLIFYFVMNILEVRTSQNGASQMCQYANVCNIVIHFS